MRFPCSKRWIQDPRQLSLLRTNQLNPRIDNAEKSWRMTICGTCHLWDICWNKEESPPMSFAITNYHLSYREKVIYPWKKVLSFVHLQKPVEFICPKKLRGEICMELNWHHPYFSWKLLNGFSILAHTFMHLVAQPFWNPLRSNTSPPSPPFQLYSSYNSWE